MKFLNLMIASLIFFPTREYTALPKDYGLISEDVKVVANDGVTLAGWYLPAPESKGTVYLLHGNAGNIADRLFKAEGWVKRGFSVFLLDYRGYGKSTGHIQNETSLYQDANAGLLWLRKEKRLSNAEIILYGESIGTAPMIELAAKERFLALILEAPFTSFVEVTKVHYPFIPALLVNAYQFNNKNKIESVDTPIFILHGTEDEICPYHMGETLFRNAKSEKEMFSVPKGHHNDLPDIAGEDFYDRPVQFIEKLKGNLK